MASNMRCKNERKSQRKEISCKIYFEGSVNREMYSKVVVEMIKQLLYQRGQLPSPYDQMKQTLERFTETKTVLSAAVSEIICTTSAPSNDRVSLKHSQLKQTFDSLSDISNQLSTALADPHNEIRQVLLLLGPTLVTPREMYLVVLPPDRTSVELVTLRKCMTRVFREMITNCCLWDGGPTSPTNAMIFLEMARRPYFEDGLIPELGFAIPNRGSRLVRFYLSEDSPPPRGNDDEATDLSDRLSKMNLQESSDSTESDYMWVKLKNTFKGLKVKSTTTKFL